MRISWNWLSDFIKSELSVYKTAEILTSIGLEVEMIEPIFSHPGGMKGLVIGEVIECQKHPNADKLSLTKVNLGSLGIVPIVCGAPNVDLGQKVVVATVGATIYPCSGSSFEIKAAKIRGEESQGMICAEDEIGIGTSHEGIIVLPSNISIGTPAAEFYQVSEDFAIEIGLTPNRTDAMSHLGVARDLHAAFIARNIPHTYFKNGQDWPQAIVSKENLALEIEILSENCTEYIAQVFKIARPNSTPKWIANRLATIGIDTIHPVVDCSNYILHDIGHPTHCFDYQNLAGKKIIVRDIESPENFSTLSGSEIKLSSGDLSIRDSEKTICLAGIIGGINSGINKNTAEIVLECAYFGPTAIRKTSQRLGIKTESSQKYEKGIDPNSTIWAKNRMAQLLSYAAGCDIASEPKHISKGVYLPFEVNLPINLLWQYIGKNIALELVRKVLNALEIIIVTENKDSWDLKVPQYRFDVRRAEDVIEEIMRILSYDIIPYPEFLKSNLSFSNGKSNYQLVENIAQNLCGDGFVEIMTNSIASSKIYQSEETIPLLNSMTSELDCLRTDLSMGFLETASYNINRDMKDLKLFEIGNVYFQSEGNYQQSLRIGILATGYETQPYWQNPKGQKSNYYTLLNSTTKILSRYFSTYQLEETKKEGYLFAVGIKCQNKTVGIIGQIDKKRTKQLDIKQEVFFAEIYLETVYEAILCQKIRYKEIPKFPSIKRDLALLVKKEINFEQIVSIAKKLHKNLLIETYLFDVFIDEKLGDLKSYAVRFVFQHLEKTFEENEIEDMMQKLIAQLKNKLGAELR